MKRKVANHGVKINIAKQSMIEKQASGGQGVLAFLRLSAYLPLLAGTG